MKKLVAMVLSVMMVFGSVQAFALDYGEEWQGYYKTPTTRYTDVSSDDWFYDSVMRVSDKNWFKGYPDGSFRPDESITRAEAVKVFDEFLGLDVQPVSKTSFYDVDSSEWYAPYIEAGKDLLPTHTTVQGKKPFNPDMPVTREDTVYALVNALGCMGNVKVVDQSVLNMFRDQNSISDNLKQYVAVALKEELVSGYEDRTIRAQDPLTRAEFATLLVRGTNHGFHNISAKISNVTLNQGNSIELEVGDSITLTAKATYTDGSNKNYTSFEPYMISGTSAAKINGKTITAVKPGTATLGFEDEYLKNSQLVITVNTPSEKPKIKLYYEDETTSDNIKINGNVQDANVDSIDLTVNDRDVQINTDGSFELAVSLKEGENEFVFKATNKYGVSASKNAQINRIVKKKEQPKDDEKDKKPEEKKISEWVEPSQVPNGANIVNRKFTYTIYDYKESESASMDGWEKYDSYWKQTKSDSFRYASFPGGFDTGNSIYQNMKKDRYYDSENATSKRVTSTKRDGYVYWHWTFSRGWLPNNNYNVFIEDHYTDKYCYFSAFTSNTNAGKVDPNGCGDGVAYYMWSGDVTQGSWWWFRTEVNICQYTDYVRVNKFRKSIEKESTTYPTDANAMGVKELVKYEM